MKQYKQRTWGVWVVNRRGYGYWDECHIWRSRALVRVRELRQTLTCAGTTITAERVTLPPPDRLREERG